MRSRLFSTETWSETWLSPDSPQATLNSLTPPGFTMLHKPRPAGLGGGVGLLYKFRLSVNNVPIPTFRTFESLCVRLALQSTSLTLLVICRPSSLAKSNFCSDFSTLLESLTSIPSEFLIAGDFNFHVDPPVPVTDTPLLDLLDTFSLEQHVLFPTHISSHTLDLIITRSVSGLVTSISSSDLGISDHLAISTTLSIPSRTRPPRVTKTVRNFRAIDIASFSKDITESSLYACPATTLETYLAQFTSCLSSILDKHAPLKTISCNDRSHKPFITKEILTEKAKRSELETIFRRTRMPTDLLNLKTQAKRVAKLISYARSVYFKTVISKCSGQPKEL